LYRRRGHTLFDHQHAAASILGFRKLTDGAERNLFGYLRKEAWDALEDEELSFRIRKWLYELRYFSLGDRLLRSLLYRARRICEDDLRAAIVRAGPADIRETWLARAPRRTALLSPANKPRQAA